MCVSIAVVIEERVFGSEGASGIRCVCVCVCVRVCVRACVPGLDARLCSVAISLFPFLNNFYFLHFFMTTSSSVTAEFTVEVGLVLILPDLFSVAESI